MSTMTRKRFEEIVGLFTREHIRTEEELREELKRILNYDPSKSTYSAKRGEQISPSRGFTGEQGRRRRSLQAIPDIPRATISDRTPRNPTNPDSGHIQQ